MSVITFTNSEKEETGKTMSLVAIATYMAVNYNNRILIISTTNTEDKINACYFGEQKTRNARLKILGARTNSLETESGMEGLAKMARSNKLTPEVITNYTKVVFSNRLEVIPGVDKNKIHNELNEEKIIDEEYISLINVAKMYYDQVFVDLDHNLTDGVRQSIIENSDLVIENTTQNLKSVEKLRIRKANNQLVSPKTLILVGKYDNNSKYNIKNITRYLGEKNKVLTVPYNTLFMEAANEAGVADFFIGLKKIMNSDQQNALFAEEVQRATEAILYRLQELHAMA